jgi:hypothetical protein
MKTGKDRREQISRTNPRPSIHKSPLLTLRKQSGVFFLDLENFRIDEQEAEPFCWWAFRIHFIQNVPEKNVGAHDTDDGGG